MLWAEHCIKSISPYSVRMLVNAGKMRDQNNSEYGHFLRSGSFFENTAPVV